MGDMNDAFMRNQNAAVQARTKAQNRANVLQLKLIGQSHPTGLTSNLLKLFEPREPLEYKPPPEKRKMPPYTGMAHLVSNFAEPGDPEYAPPAKKAETSAQRRARIHLARLEAGAKKAAEELQKYDPSSDPNISGDPYKTLFVARLNHETTEHKVKREFESYGPIKKIKVRMVTDKVNNKPRGYAFIEYAHTRDMKAAYKQADGKKLDNRRVLVDVERGRTVPNWRPRRLGGGLGSTRVGGEDVNMKYSGREPQQLTSGGPSRSAEPRAREERLVDRDREKSRDRGRDRDREREKSRERSHDRTRDRERSYDRTRDLDPREERHQRDRDRRDRDRDRDRDRERSRDHDRIRDRERSRDYDRSKDRDRDRDRGRERPRERERDYDRGEPERDRGRSRDKESDYDRVDSKHGRGRHGERDRDHDHLEHGYELPEPKQDLYQRPQDQGDYDHFEPQAGHEHYDHHPDRKYDQYDQLEPEDYQYDRPISEPRGREKLRNHEWDYRRSERSVSHEIEH